MGLILNDAYVQLAFISLIMLISFVLLRRGKHLNLKEPPLVPYKYPIIGHTIDYYKDNENFIKKCHAEYGEIFSLYLFGKVQTFVGKELFPEVFRNHNDFCFNEAGRENFPLENFLNRPNEFTDTLPRMVQINLSGQIKLYTERVQRQLIKSIDEMIGNVLEPPLKFFQFIIAKPIAATMVGEELSDDKELVNSFANVTTDFIPFLSIPPVLNFIHPYLHRQVMIIVFKYLNNPFKMHRELIKKKITPVIEKRLREMKESGDNYVSPIDILQRYTELLHKDYTVDIDVVTDNMIISIFASVYNTSNSLTFCLTWYKLVNNPQFLKEILEEQEQLYKSNEKSYYSTEQIARMEKLDSFIKETLRVNVNNVALQHKTLSSYFTFSNGYQVPKGRLVNIRLGEVHFDKELQSQNADEFNAFRYLKKNSPATRADNSFLTFGLGKHTCPGRQFAVNEIKVALHYLLLNYDIKKSTSEKIKPKIYGSFKFPSDEGLIFEKKSV
ncbi:unnamed protein product [Rhizophagus irregularis]|nr:unnamed protein product [Rhizophagus irregularis]